MSRQQGALYLIPSPLGSNFAEITLPGPVMETARNLKVFIVENARSARRFLKEIGIKTPLPEVKMLVLDEHTTAEDSKCYLDDALEGNDIGLLSEAGCPVVADPGRDIVMLAHGKGIRVIPLTGPSSIVLALMASGFSGQRFRFLGYLPADSGNREKSLKKIERECRENKETQIFIEAPYRNNQLMASVIGSCSPGLNLCVAADLTLPSEFICTLTLRDWKKNRPDLHRRPAVFLLSV